MNHHRRRRLLADPGAEGPRSRVMGAGPAGAKATREFYREHGHDEIPARGPLAALTVPGAVGDLAGCARGGAGAFGGKMPLDVLLGAAIRRAREGYAVTRSQARLTADKLPEMEKAVGFREAFLTRRQGAGRRRAAQSRRICRRRSINSRMPALTISTAAMSAAKLLPISNASAAPVTRADLEKFQADRAEPLSVDDAARHALQFAAADAGTCLTHHPRAV